jgi:hypothetical protein
MLQDDTVPLTGETIRHESVISDEFVTMSGLRQNRLGGGEYVATRSRPNI